MLPHFNSFLLAWGRQCSRPRPRWGQQWQQLETLWSWNHLATLALPSLPPPGGPPGALAKLGVWRSCLWPRA